jgi:hypothetical protein
MYELFSPDLCTWYRLQFLHMPLSTILGLDPSTGNAIVLPCNDCDRTLTLYTRGSYISSGIN